MSLILPPLSHRYQENHFHLETPEMTLSGNGFIALIGRNGSGKSTFARTLATMNDDSDSDKWFYVPQFSERFLFAENLRAQIQDLLFTDIRPEKLADELRDMGFEQNEDMFDFPFLLMSGGERRRVALACAFYMQPDKLILDEPSIGLTRKETMVILQKINNLIAMGTHLIIATHDMELVEKSSDIICLENGNVNTYGSAGAFLHQSDSALNRFGIRYHADH